jgi:hypothetical protein
MAWQTLKYRLKSDCPMIQHNGQTADPSNKFSRSMKEITSKRNKTDADYEELARIEFMAGLYMSSDGPIIPSYVIDAMIVNAAKKLRQGPKAKSACFCFEHSLMEYEGPKDFEGLWESEDFRFSSIVRVQSSRVARMRPIFNKWEATVVLQIEDTLINVRDVDEWMSIAGTQVGIGDWRPQYGRFTAERLNGK